MLSYNIYMDDLDNSGKFLEYREKYPEFWYKSYAFSEDSEAFNLEFEFEVPGLMTFRPKSRILKKNLPWQEIPMERKNLFAFNIGLAELVSYWKATCSPRVMIKCGSLTETQIAWWKKLYYYGLGELFYRNHITTNQEDFMSIEAEGLEQHVLPDEAEKSGYLIPIGGGKDSIVTLESLDIDYERDFVAILNPKTITKKCAELAGFGDEKIVAVERKIDANLLELNNRGFINGHTPFSSVLAFYLSLAAEMLGKKYLVVSNENSANEANVSEVDANHQYSKSFEFEEDFRQYAREFLQTKVEYFSYLRPLNELEIAKIFSRHEKYFSTFKSCNVGSKFEPWTWCGDCPKCLFAFVILSPFLYRDKLVEIFGQDLLERTDLYTMLLQLSGDFMNKPFECVGTYAEVQLALKLIIEKLKNRGEELPILLQKYNDEFGSRDVDENLLSDWNMENNLTAEQEDYLKKVFYHAK